MALWASAGGVATVCTARVITKLAKVTSRISVRNSCGRCVCITSIFHSIPTGLNLITRKLFENWLTVEGERAGNEWAELALYGRNCLRICVNFWMIRRLETVALSPSALILNVTKVLSEEGISRSHTHPTA